MFLINNLDLFTVGLATAAMMILGFIVYFNNQKSITNKTFLAFSLITVLWSIFNYLSYIFTDKIIVLWLLRLVIFLAVWQDFFLLRFSYFFPKEEAESPKVFKYILLPWSAIVAIITLSSLVFQSVAEFSPDGRVSKVINGPGIILFGITVISFIIASIIIVVKKFINFSGIQRTQAAYLLIGIVVTFTSHIIFNFVLPAFFDNPNFVPLGAVFIFPLIAFASYAIIKHQLLNIKIIGTEIIAFLVSVISFIEILLSNNIIEVIFRSSVFILLLIFSVALVKSVINEVKTREQIQKLVDQLKIANEKLKQLDMFKSEFLSIASHQLRTPLTILRGYTSMAKEGAFGEFNQQQKDVIDKLAVSSERLIALVEDLLDISRLEKGKIEYNFKIQNIIPLIKEVFEELKPKAQNKNLEFNLILPEKESLLVRIDEKKMREVIFNIIDNAIKYTEKGSVTVELKYINSSIAIDVTDTGMGITKEELSTLFQKFVRGARVSQFYTEGTGLGLYYAKRVTEDHNGEIYATSPGPEKGSTFHIKLPVV